jgi:hypothetical protein
MASSHKTCHLQNYTILAKVRNRVAAMPTSYHQTTIRHRLNVLVD